MDTLYLKLVADQQKEEGPVFLACGHTAMAEQHMRDGSVRPACVICFGDPRSTQVAVAPDLTGRMARCAYFGKGGFRDHGPIYGGGPCDQKRCSCLVPSSITLPFFEHKPKQAEDRFFCGCAGWD